MMSCFLFTFVVIAFIIAVEKLVRWLPRRYEPERLSDEAERKYFD